jgi:hypothetical protein
MQPRTGTAHQGHVVTGKHHKTYAGTLESQAKTNKRERVSITHTECQKSVKSHRPALTNTAHPHAGTCMHVQGSKTGCIRLHNATARECRCRYNLSADILLDTTSQSAPCGA